MYLPKQCKFLQHLYKFNKKSKCFDNKIFEEFCPPVRCDDSFVRLILNYGNILLHLSHSMTFTVQPWVLSFTFCFPDCKPGKITAQLESHTASLSCAQGLCWQSGHQGIPSNPFLSLAFLLRHNEISTGMFYIKYKTTLLAQYQQPSEVAVNVNSTQKETQTKLFF